MINDANLYVHVDNDVDNEPPIMRFDYPEIPNGNYKKFYNIFTWLRILIKSIFMSVAVLDRESSE
jgi:hypothetical protein